MTEFHNQASAAKKEMTVAIVAVEAYQCAGFDVTQKEWHLTDASAWFQTHSAISAEGSFDPSDHDKSNGSEVMTLTRTSSDSEKTNIFHVLIQSQHSLITRVQRQSGEEEAYVTHVTH